MDTDLMLVIGIILAILLVPSYLSAWTHGHTPRVTAIVTVIAFGLILLALTNNPQGYTVDQVPAVFARVILRF